MNRQKNGSAVNASAPPFLPPKNRALFNARNMLLLVGASLWLCVCSSCSKQADKQDDVTTWYKNLDHATQLELQAARAATARYKDFNNALADGYQDIMVDVEGMGHHYMNPDLVDSTFDLAKPEILVYNRDENNQLVLVAVEYAVPINLPKPEGFTGDADEWNGNSPFPYWLLHAWVWAYNPEGAFHWTNPLIHLH